jgi:hypothetical protein
MAELMAGKDGEGEDSGGRVNLRKKYRKKLSIFRESVLWVS